MTGKEERQRGRQREGETERGGDRDREGETERGGDKDIGEREKQITEEEKVLDRET